MATEVTTTMFVDVLSIAEFSGRVSRRLLADAGDVSPEEIQPVLAAQPADPQLVVGLVRASSDGWVLDAAPTEVDNGAVSPPAMFQNLLDTQAGYLSRCSEVHTDCAPGCNRSGSRATRSISRESGRSPR